jgi:interferon gamma-inducible protein 30
MNLKNIILMNVLIFFLLNLNSNVSNINMKKSSITLKGSFSKILEIDIFYESLCPFSNQFISETIHEFMEIPNFRKFVKINFHPFGKAKDKTVNLNFKFECQHGENECFGNKIQLCALKKLNEENGMNFVICFMTAIPQLGEDMSSALYACVPKKLYKEIQECSYGEEGNLLMHQEAKISPDLDHVPAIVVNGKYDTDVENDIRFSLRDYFCKIGQNMQLKECKTSNGNVEKLIKDKIKEISKEK